MRQLFCFFLSPLKSSISSLLHPRLLPSMWYFVQSQFLFFVWFDYFWDPRRPIPPVSLPVITAVLSLMSNSPALNGDLFLKWVPKFLGFPNPLLWNSLCLFLHSCYSSRDLAAVCVLNMLALLGCGIICHLVLQLILFIAT